MTAIFRKSHTHLVFAILVEGQGSAGLVTKVFEDGTKASGDYHAAIRTSRPAVPSDYASLRATIERQLGHAVRPATRMIYG